MEAKTEKLFKRILGGFKPTIDLSISRWADNYRYLSSEASAEVGKWNTDRAPYQRAILDCITSSDIYEITVMSSAQVGKTEILLNAIGRYMHLDPCPIMLIQPTDTMCKAFSKDRVAPMLRDSPVLKKLVKGVNIRDSGNTVMQKAFPGGHLTFVGSNSPSGLASRPIRILMADEVDRFPRSAGNEGDPLSLAEKRTTTFWNRKHIRVSTPTVKGISKIEKLYNLSSMERWNIPCPSCGEYQVYDFDRVKWELEKGEVKEVTMMCEHCGVLHSEKEWKKEKQLNGKWIAEHPNRKHKGFHLNEFASPFKSWEEIIKDYEESKEDPEKLKTFVNTSLGEPFEEEVGDIIDYRELFDNRIPYGADLHDDILILTGGVDVQDDRLEVEIVGWGLGEKSYGVAYKKIYGNPAEDEVWMKLDEYLEKEFTYRDGEKLKVTTTCIDTGGHHTKKTYDYLRPRAIKRIFGIKGRGGEGVPMIANVKKDKINKMALISIGVNSLKDLTYARLKIKDGQGKAYFPSHPKARYDLNYFKSLTAEVKVIENKKIVWKQIRKRNEGLDLRNYATAALGITRANLEKLDRLRKERLDKKFKL